MKKIKLLATAITLSLSTAVFAQSLEIGAGIPMGNDKFTSVDKKEVSLNSAKTANGLLVMFSCNTCPYVIKSQERTKETIDYAKKMDIGMVIVNSNAAQRDGADSHEAMSRYAKKQGYSVPYIGDDQAKLADAFGAMRTPEVFLFDATGKLVYKGAMEDSPADPAASKQMFLKNAINNMLAGAAPDPSTTKSIGCTIKRL
ncbi:redoxin family protein [Polluticoccus soli]|uniref:redoxin family protein n=1 Tax=Polluticoccus soli TaxID=3034150 RepID=UPI0023E2AFF7|nr:redoxin family protein [Flavipsychrobacter sp. JY13-12]